MPGYISRDDEKKLNIECLLHLLKERKENTNKNKKKGA